MATEGVRTKDYSVLPGHPHEIRERDRETKYG